jgi:hypothetical protein
MAEPLCRCENCETYYHKENGHYVEDSHLGWFLYCSKECAEINKDDRNTMAKEDIATNGKYILHYDLLSLITYVTE